MADDIERDIGVPEPVGRPLYGMMADARATAVHISVVGGAAWEAAMKAEVRQAMDDLGTRVVLWYAERIDNVNAVLGEFSA